MKASLGVKADKAAIVANVESFISRAVGEGLEVEFSPEGYSRMGENFDFVSDLIRAAISAGARVINCPDTIGGACSFQGQHYFVNALNRHAQIMAKEFPEVEVCWSTHCHNDFGLAVENSINGVFFGPARQIEGCFNGVGERAGNASLEQCIMIIKHFADHENKESPLFTNINTEAILEISDFVAKHMLPRQPHYPISGRNSAKHSSGGHKDY